MTSEKESTPTSRESMLEWVAERWEEHYDRPRGIFTDVDRRYLWGIKEYDNSVTRSERRSTIRTRAVNGILDLFYLTMLPEGQREKVISTLREDVEFGEFRSAVSSFVNFLYLGLDGDKEWLEEAVSMGVHNAEMELDEVDRYGIQEVSVDIDISRGHDLDQMKERLHEAPHTLTPTEIGILVREGQVDREGMESLDMSNYPDDHTRGPESEVDNSQNS